MSHKAEPVPGRPPGPRSRFPGALLFEARRDMLGLMTRIAHEYGDIAYLDAGSMSFYLVSHPDHVRDILVTNHHNFTKSRALEMSKLVLGEGLLTSDGEFHRRQRRLMLPALHRQRIQAYGTAMTGYAEQLSRRWQPGATVNMHEQMIWLTTAIVAKTIFNADVEGEAAEIRDAVNTVIGMFDRVMIPFAEFLVRLPLPSNRRFWQARERLNATIYRIIEEHRQSGVDQGDLVSMLLLAQDEAGDHSGMTDEQVRDEAITVFLAGQETTANALTFTWYLLAQHPEVEAKLHAEIDTVLDGRAPTVDDLPRLKYSEMVFSEAMRLYPPAYALGRRAIDDFRLGDYCVPAGSTVLMSQWVIHRDPRFFPDPLRFDPDRWTPEAKETRPKFAYFPFGGGPRVCIGDAFAWMEGSLVLATLAQRWQPRLVSTRPVELQPLITLRPKGGVMMRLEARGNVSAGRGHGSEQTWAGAGRQDFSSSSAVAAANASCFALRIGSVARRRSMASLFSSLIASIWEE